jgi:hypothetical protein
MRASVAQFTTTTTGCSLSDARIGSPLHKNGLPKTDARIGSHFYSAPMRASKQRRQANWRE